MSADTRRAGTVRLTATTLGPQLRELRDARGLAQKDLAERLGIRKQQLFQIEAGYYVPSLKVLETILAELGAHLEIAADEGRMLRDTSRRRLGSTTEAS